MQNWNTQPQSTIVTAQVKGYVSNDVPLLFADNRVEGSRFVQSIRHPKTS